MDREEKEELLQNKVIMVVREYFGLDDYTSSFTRMFAKDIIDLVREEETKLKEEVIKTLEFYGNDNNYCIYEYASEIEIDDGKRARNLLKKLKED
jgi:hypothetical protein